jgi:HlyD family secretion protein
MTAVRKAGLVLGAAALVAILAFGLRSRSIPAALVMVSEGPLQLAIRETGRTRVKDRYRISAPVQAFAPRIELEPGDPVEAGQTLLILEPVPSSVLDSRSVAEARARVDRNEAALRAAESRFDAIGTQLELAAHELDRMRPLYQQGTISVSQYERALTAHRRLEAEHRSARFDVEVARQDLRFAEATLDQYQAGSEPMQSFPVLAPVSGQVLDVVHESAGIVQPGQDLLSVADPASLEVVVELLSADAVRVQEGMIVELLRWGGETALLGEVRLIERAGFTKVSALGVEEQRVVAVVDLVSPFERWSVLGDGYRVEARFILWQEESVLQVPNGAVFRHEGGWALFRVEDGRARLQSVELGPRGETHVQVLGGVAAGDRVIAHPANDIEDGSRVRPFVR